MQKKLGEIAQFIRYLILTATTGAGSGHPTSCLSSVELMTALLFGGVFKYNIDDPSYPNNDRLIFSKGHAAPLLYALWVAAGAVSVDEMMTLRRFGSRLEGHPTPAFPFAEAATGSLGQGLSIGVGMALNARFLDGSDYRTYVLLGDSEMTEGAQWEAMLTAVHYRLDNLIGIIDVNRLGQSGESLLGGRVEEYERRISAFGWSTAVIDGHSLEQVCAAYQQACIHRGSPFMIIAETIKGKGVPPREDKNGFHGKPLSGEDLQQALDGLGEVDMSVRGAVSAPALCTCEKENPKPADRDLPYRKGEVLTNRKAYGSALKRLCPSVPQMVVLDAEVKNSTYAEIFSDAFPGRYFEMYIAEQNMVSAALGLALRGKKPFVSSFAAFFTRACDQIRMCPYSGAHIIFCGSHAGVAVGPDGPSQMGLNDIALFRGLFGSTVFYPCDAVATERLVELSLECEGIVYIRTTRNKLPVIYSPEDTFSTGGCSVLRISPQDRAAVIAAGITTHQALEAWEQLRHEGVDIRIIDLYCIKPIDRHRLERALSGIDVIITVEDHVPEGGMGEAVNSALEGTPVQLYSLAVRDVPKSGTTQELLDFENISAQAIADTVRRIL